MPKSKSLNDVLDVLSERMTGKPRKPGSCPTCGKKADEFRDDLSRKEFLISGMCQDCQDSVFGGEP